ncbi:MAG: serine/threonine protein kinase [Myxococcales bacterium]|nr:serine/threonine protein kinase [Myxococcales bacterium]
MQRTETQTQVDPIGAGIPIPVHDDRSMRSRQHARDTGPDGAPDIGSRVGRYVLEQRIGEGGMGVVYRAFDPDVGRTVALKFARAQHGTIDARVWSRLRREAQALARVHHPSVVGLYEMGHDPRGAYLALELVEGVHLRRWLQARPRPLAQIVAVLERVAVALGAVHRCNLLHRDIKPTNILVTPEDRVVLVDFGLALGFSELTTAPNGEVDNTCRTRMTRMNTVVGTTHYMSPEQLMGRDLDVRSDVFSLAVTAYEAVYGQRPFAETTAYGLAVTYDAAIPPTPPRGDAPRWLRRALLDALAIDPKVRTGSAEAFAAALRPRRYGGLALLAAVAGGALLGAGAASLGLGPPSETAKTGAGPAAETREAGMAVAP